MILKHLFLQYKTSNGPTWGSRFMKACGELVLGNLEKKGLGHLRKDLKDTYYYIKEDRNLPKESGLMAWQIQSMLLAQYRELEAPQVSRATLLGLLPVIFICVVAASPFNGTFQASMADGSAGKFGNLVSGVTGGGEFGEMTKAKCDALRTKVETGQMQVEDIPNVKEVDAQCRSLARN